MAKINYSYFELSPVPAISFLCQWYILQLLVSFYHAFPMYPFTNTVISMYRLCSFLVPFCSWFNTVIVPLVFRLLPTFCYIVWFRHGCSNFRNCKKPYISAYPYTEYYKYWMIWQTKYVNLLNLTPEYTNYNMSSQSSLAWGHTHPFLQTHELQTSWNFMAVYWECY